MPAVRRHVRLPRGPETLKGADAFLQWRCAMVTNPSYIDRFERGVTGALREGWRFLLIEGIILAALGAAAIIVPPIATLAVEIILGWLFFISGIVGLVMTFMMRHAPGFWWSLFSAALKPGAWRIMKVMKIGRAHV